VSARMSLERQIVRTGMVAGPTIVLLHGYDGTSQDLEPFARSLGLPATFVFPEGPIPLVGQRPGARAWWTPDADREASIASGTPRDLSSFEPEGLDQAHALLSELLDELAGEASDRPLILGGFSQGAMLAFDVTLRSDRAVAGLVQLSGSRIAERLWTPRVAERHGMRAFISHGRQDADLSFAGAESFKNDLVLSGWNVDFCPFDGGHEIPLPVLRRLKKFLAEF
jgi:phospholipase/carboxylesterase